MCQLSDSCFCLIFPLLPLIAAPTASSSFQWQCTKGGGKENRTLLDRHLWKETKPSFSQRGLVEGREVQLQSNEQSGRGGLLEMGFVHPEYTFIKSYAAWELSTHRVEEGLGFCALVLPFHNNRMTTVSSRMLD